MNNSRKTGRPEKQIKKNRILALKCNIEQEIEIRNKAALYNLPVSIYLRDLALKHQVNIRTLPHEVLLFQTRINQLCSLANQLARKKNKNEPFNVIERAQLSEIIEELQDIVKSIKQYIYDIQS